MEAPRVRITEIVEERPAVFWTIGRRATGSGTFFGRVASLADRRYPGNPRRLSFADFHVMNLLAYGVATIATRYDVPSTSRFDCIGEIEGGEEDNPDVRKWA